MPLETMDEEASQPCPNELADGNNQEVRESEDPESIQPQISAPLVSVSNPVSEEMDTESSQPQPLNALPPTCHATAAGNAIGSDRPQTFNEPVSSGHEEEVMEIGDPQTPVDASALYKLLGFDGSESNESCQAFFTRKMQELGADIPEEEIPTGEEAPLKSESELIVTFPDQGPKERPLRQFQRSTAVAFLDSVTAISASSDSISASSKPEPLKVSSRALLKEYFAKAEPVELLSGHSTLALTEDQIACVLRVVADETARASYDMLESLVYRASRLNLNTSVPSKRVPRKSSVGSISQRPDKGESETEAGSDTSGAIRSCDDFESIGYAYEHSENELIATPPSSRPNLACGPNDPASSTLHFDAYSPGSQTLAALQRGAVWDQSVSRSRPGRRRTSTTRGRTRRPITRSCKIMKEAYFKGMEWTSTFVSGPVNPRWNPYKFYCQICKANISIYGKGAREILRHHSTDKHLRKDQRWRSNISPKLIPLLIKLFIKSGEKMVNSLHLTSWSTST